MAPRGVTVTGRKSVADLLKAGSRGHDFACRYGGEEFVIILPDTSAQEAYVIAERIRKSVEHHKFKKNGAEYNVTISLGITDQLDETDMEDLIKRADDALYQAKNKGRNQTIRF